MPAPAHNVPLFAHSSPSLALLPSTRRWHVLCAQPQPGAALSAEEQEALDARLWDAAVLDGDAAAVERLAGEGASADAKDEEYGDPAVAAAAREGHTEVVEALLRLGCDPNAPASGNVTALMRGAIQGRGGVVGALLEHGGAELDAVDSDGQTALMYAVNDRAEIARLLLEAGADATLRATGGDWEGMTALELVEESRRWKDEKISWESDEDFAARRTKEEGKAEAK